MQQPLLENGLASDVMGIEYLTFAGIPPEAFISLAADAGYGAVGLRLHGADADEVVPDLTAGTPRRREVAARLEDTGLRVLDIEVFAVTPTTDVRNWLPLLESGAALGAQFVNVVADDPDLSRLTASLHTLGEICAPLGLIPALEPMAWKTVSRLGVASRIAKDAGIRVQLDTLHLHRAGDSVDDVRALDPSIWSYVQWSDAPAEPPSEIPLELRQEGRSARLAPGLGELPLEALRDALPADLIWATEVPSATNRARVGDVQHAREVRAATEALIV